MQDHNDLLKYLESLRLSRDIREVMLRGVSVIDSRNGIPVTNVEQVQDFLHSYGYDIERPVEAAELMGNYQEALRFIKKYFLKPENPEGANLEIPKIFYEITDIRQLILYSSDKSMEHTLRTRWACSILRVMHTVAHLDKDLRYDYFPTIQTQVFDRFYKAIHNADGKIYLGDPKTAEAVELVKFQTKPRKARDSSILKLLHKSENVAEDIFDQVGVRFVAKNTVDVLRVLRFLREHFIVMPMNIRPSRSRNNLVDVFNYRRIWRETRSLVNKGKITSIPALSEHFEMELHTAMKNVENTPENPFSSSSYRSIQFTCRQLIKYRNPIYADVKSLRNDLRAHVDPEIKKLADRIDLAHIAKEQRFFYPYEVQIFNESNHHEAESGNASHAVYRAAQVQAAMKRVLGILIQEPRK